MNRKNLTLIAAALLSGQAFAADVANWAPDAGATAAYPALVQVQAPGKTRAEVRADLNASRANVANAIQWTPDAAASDAFPAQARQVVAAGKSRDEVRAEASTVRFARTVLDTREGA